MTAQIISRSCPGYDFNKGGKILGRNFTMKINQAGKCVHQTVKQKFMNFKKKNKLFCLKKNGNGQAQKVFSGYKVRI